MSEPKPTYLVVVPQIVGNLESWSMSFTSPLPGQFTDRPEALRAGEQELGHDDFCIATLRGGKLFAYGFGMDDFAPEDRDGLAEIGRQLSIAVHPDAPPDAPAELDPKAVERARRSGYELLATGRGWQLTREDDGLHLGVGTFHGHALDGVSRRLDAAEAHTLARALTGASQPATHEE
jgi:hypothetical protein